MRSKEKLAAEKRRETHFLSNEEQEQWIEDYCDRETAGARKRVDDAEAPVQQEEDDMKHAEIVGLTNRESEKTFGKMMVAVGATLSDLASSNNGEDVEVEDDKETEHSMLS